MRRRRTISGCAFAQLFPAYGSVVDRLIRPWQERRRSCLSARHRRQFDHAWAHTELSGADVRSLLHSARSNGDDFRLPELSLPDGVTIDRLQNRREVMNLIDRSTEMLEISSRARGIDAHYNRALTMLTSPRFRRAFDLSSEPVSVREKYGRTTYGQGCLLARRLVEVGVKFVTVYFAASIGGQSKVSGGWDTHGFNDVPVSDSQRLSVANHRSDLPTLIGIARITR